MADEREPAGSGCVQARLYDVEARLYDVEARLYDVEARLYDVEARLDDVEREPTGCGCFFIALLMLMLFWLVL